MKRFVVTGYKDGWFVFSFPLNAINSYYAIQYASEDELVEGMEFDKLVIKEVKE
ncbi:holliday junction resolvase [Streptococcus phage D4446]|nr:holliday junction resolvase [Streptococcus phage D4446]